jgi:hypothetical protein
MTSDYLLRAFELLSKLHVEPRDLELTESEILEREKRLGVQFPETYRVFLKRYGTLVHGDLAVFGLGVPPQILPSIECAVHTARAIHPDMPLALIPIHVIEKGVFACIDCDSEHIRLWVANRPIGEQNWTYLAGSFEEYLFKLIAKPFWHQKGFEILKRHVDQYQSTYQYDHAKGGKLPRNHEWRPYRFCIQDVLFGSTVVRHLREANCLQVDVFLTADIPEYGPFAGALALISFLLSEAYKCGGTMEVRFTKNVEDGQVPQELQDLARQYEIVFSQADNGKILPSEAKALYAALTGFSPSLKQKIYELEQAGRVKMARACYVVHHGVWSKEQVEMIVLGSEQPDSVLSGQTQAHQRHLYLHDLLHARAALLGGMLDRVLSQRQRISDDGVTYDMEDDVRTLTISFDGELYAKKYHSDDEIPLPWLYPDNQTREVPGGMPFNVLVRARDISDQQLHLATDVKQAADYRQKTQQPTLLLLPNDFMVLPDALRQKLYQQAQTAQIGLMVCPDPVSVFDVEAAEKLARSRILRQ